MFYFIYKFSILLNVLTIIYICVMNMDFLVQFTECFDNVFCFIYMDFLIYFTECFDNIINILYCLL